MVIEKAKASDRGDEFAVQLLTQTLEEIRGKRAAAWGTLEGAKRTHAYYARAVASCEAGLRALGVEPEPDTLAGQQVDP